MNKQSGFTIIELITVISLLGILAAVALPRFINLTHEAHNAAVEGAAGGLASGVVLVRARAFVDDAGDGEGVSVEGGINLAVSGDGFPRSASGGAIGPGGCVEVWDGVLQGSRPIASTAATAPDNNIAYTVTQAGTVCTYTYREPNTENGANTPRVITYDFSNGDVQATGTN